MILNPFIGDPQIVECVGVDYCPELPDCDYVALVTRAAGEDVIRVIGYCESVGAALTACRQFIENNKLEHKSVKIQVSDCCQAIFHIEGGFRSVQRRLASKNL